MKKVLAVLLVVMMLFTSLSMGASAVAPEVAKEYYTSLKNAGILKKDQVIVSFDLLLSGAKFTYPVSVYDENTNTFINTQDITGVYYMVPNNKDISSSSYMTPGSSIILPQVTPPEGKDYRGWQYTEFGGSTHVLAPGSNFIIPEGSSSFGVICFTAVFTTGEIKGDILDTLVSVFITIVSKLAGLLNLGIDEETIQNLLGNLL